MLETPVNAIEWEACKLDLRSKLWHVLGDMPKLFVPDVKITERETHSDYILEKFQFANGLGDLVYGYLLLPTELQEQAPAVMYLHNHGGKYDVGKSELFRQWPTETPPGIALVQAGYIVMAIDAYAFEERQHQGPGGAQDSGYDTEVALFKKFLWEGRTLWGMMLHDDFLALNILYTHRDVDKRRIAVTGSSMGASRATWLAALDERIRTVIPVIQMTRYKNYIKNGNMNGHSIYYFVPGILQQDLDMEIITALVAPRPQCILVGDSDPLSPIEGIRTIDAFTREVYRLYGGRYKSIVYEGVGHKYTPQMFAEMLDFLALTLTP